jgi:glycosyltransferase involved in cell wall biosynthesis
MIVKNEERVIEKCLSSVKPIVDEIVIVDTGSTDRTKEIAKTFTDHLFDYKWEDDFSAHEILLFLKK